LGLENGPRATFRIIKVTPDGDTILARSLSYVQQPITREDEEWLRDGFAMFVVGNPSRGPQSPFGAPDESTLTRQRQEARAAIRFPAFFPPVRQIVAGHDGSVWLLREFRPDRGDLWEIYDVDGRLAGSVLIPTGAAYDLPWAPRLKVLRATRDEVWGMTIGEYDVPVIHRYRVRRNCP
jgi:hypothetical protein